LEKGTQDPKFGIFQHKEGSEIYTYERFVRRTDIVKQVRLSGNIALAVITPQQQLKSRIIRNGFTQIIKII
jgi:hypothetical protein